MTKLCFQQKVLTKLLAEPQNFKCADCNTKSPTWASLDYGVFVCLNCSGAHRRLGPRYTRVKSTTLDTWNAEWADLMVLNNETVNRYWEHDLGTRKKPTSNSSLEEIMRFVQQKYLKKKFALPDTTDPVTDLKNGNINLPITPQKKPQFKPQSRQDTPSTKPVTNASIFDDIDDPKLDSPNIKPLTNDSTAKTTLNQEINLLDFAEPVLKKTQSQTNPNISLNLIPQPQLMHTTSQSLYNSVPQNYNTYTYQQTSNVYAYHLQMYQQQQQLMRYTTQNQIPQYTYNSNPFPNVDNKIDTQPTKVDSYASFDQFRF